MVSPSQGRKLKAEWGQVSHDSARLSHLFMHQHLDPLRQFLICCSLWI